MSGTFDRHLVSSVIYICRQGAAFYQRLSEQVASVALSSLFREMSQSRRQAALNLSTSERQPEEVAAVSGVTARVDNMYNNLALTPDQYRNVWFLDRLEQTEAQVLNTLRNSVSQLSDSQLAEQLARAIATLQIANDRLKSFKADAERRLVGRY